MAMISMSSNDWQDVISAIQIADGESMMLGAQRLIAKIERQLGEQED